jgi:hypothetical protein
MLENFKKTVFRSWLVTIFILLFISIVYLYKEYNASGYYEYLDTNNPEGYMLSLRVSDVLLRSQATVLKLNALLVKKDRENKELELLVKTKGQSESGFKFTSKTNSRKKIFQAKRQIEYWSSFGHVNNYPFDDLGCNWKLTIPSGIGLRSIYFYNDLKNYFWLKKPTFRRINRNSISVCFELSRSFWMKSIFIIITLAAIAYMIRIFWAAISITEIGVSIVSWVAGLWSLSDILTKNVPTRFGLVDATFVALTTCLVVGLISKLLYRYTK